MGLYLLIPTYEDNESFHYPEYVLRLQKQTKITDEKGKFN